MPSPSELLATATAQRAAADHDGCAASARRALDLGGGDRAALFALATGCLERAESIRAAVALGRQGMAEFPQDPELAVLTGIAELALRHDAEARALAKTAIGIRPRYARAHDLLARAYFAGGYLTPSVLASLHALALEPTGVDAKPMAEFLVSTLRRGATQETASSTTILLPPDRPKDEGDYTVTDLVIAMTAAGRFTNEGKARSETEQIVEQVRTLLTILQEGAAREARTAAAGSFPWRTYVPTLAAIGKEELVEPFVYRLTASLDLPGAKAWRAAHGEQLAKVEQALERLLPAQP